MNSRTPKEPATARFAATITVRVLRRQWKPHKERLNGVDPEHPTNVRFHRACSWIQRADLVSEKSDLDLALVSQWNAFNALYGRWDDAAREPVPDCACWKQFVDRMLALDQSSFIADALMENKPLVMSIFDDELLSRYFWQEPTGKRASKSKKTKYDAQTWFLQRNWTLILDRLIERIYLLRCQLFHGAATYNSSLRDRAGGDFDADTAEPFSADLCLPGEREHAGKRGAPCVTRIINSSTNSRFFETMNKRRQGYPSETQVKRGVQIIHGDKLLEEKLGRNDLCPCGSGRRFKKCCLTKGCF